MKCLDTEKQLHITILQYIAIHSNIIHNVALTHIVSPLTNTSHDNNDCNKQHSKSDMIWFLHLTRQELNLAFGLIQNLKIEVWHRKLIVAIRSNSCIASHLKVIG